MLEGLLWTLLGLVALATGLLAVPVEVVASLDVSARRPVTLRIKWLFGLVRARREVGARKPASPGTSNERRRGRGRRRPDLTVIQHGIRLIGEILGQVNVRRARLDLSVGVDDPAATGEIVGVLAPVVAMANALPRTRVAIRPSFTGPTLEGGGEGEFRVVPIRLVPALLGFALSPEVRRWYVSRRRA